ncbi:MarR family winged helix-turn-helix transcriptional regulator [Georgenia satyanarayanai]|uniref:MarR family winged helix-turn-helix transcriptional regulator n=1 Tax=Georgenia satyanarayanai TaxID=860221 RepID=UPI0012645FDD|nr:MarR family transcriptional regulator [Georgenia satyanarayanai]
MSDPRWLSPVERETWLSISELVTTLQGALDTRLQQHAGVTFYEYMVMAMLSEQADRTLQLSELAELTSGSLSRLSHVLTRLERHGWVVRERSPLNPRARIATLTDEGLGKVEQTAPAHVRDVRELVFDAIAPHDVPELARILAPVLDRARPPGRRVRTGRGLGVR